MASLRSNRRCLIIAGLLALSNAQYGFDAAVISSFQAMDGFLQVFGYKETSPKSGWNIDTTSQQLITSFLNVGTIIGVLFTGPFSHYFGRRQGIWAGTVLGLAGAGIQMGTTTIAGLCVGRSLIGASNAFYFTFANAYVVEIVPPRLRSVCSGAFGVTTSVGGLLGAAVTYLTKGVEGKHCYQIGLACLFFFPLILSAVTLCVPESPRWLLVNNRTAEARRSLERLRRHAAQPQPLVEDEFCEMIRGIEEEKALASTSSTSLVEMFRGPNLRRSILCIGTVTSRAVSGIWVFLSYGTYFFKQAGIGDPFAMSMCTIAAGLVGACFAMYCSHRLLGRRSMILIATASAALTMLGAALGGTIAPNSRASATNFAAFSIIYSVSYGGFSSASTWPISAEVVSSRLRILSLSIATAIDYILAWLTAFCSPYFINPKALNWGARYCWLWAGFNGLAYVFFYFLLPEMKGRSLEEIDEMFDKGIRTRDFATYVCTDNAIRAADDAASQKRPKVLEGEASESAV